MSRNGRLDVFVLIDALGWRVLADREFLSDLLPYRAPLRTVLGYSSAAIPTILTGTPPSEHGHWNLLYYDPDHSPFRWLGDLRFLPDGLLDHRLTRQLLKQIGRRLLGLGPLFECCVHPRLLPWFDWVEKRNIYQRDGIAGASSIFDALARHGIPHRVYSYHHWSDREILRRAQQDLAAGAARFLFLYLSELDGFLHGHRGEGRLLEERLTRYATGLRRVFARALERDPDAGLTIVSDHGMARVRHTYDLVSDVEASGFRMPDDYLAVYDSTMARFWFFSGRARRVIVERLERVPCGRIVPDAELDELGVLFPDRRYGEVIWLLDAGWLLARSDFSRRGWRPAGMHGYHPDDPDSDAVFLSNRPPLVPLRTIRDVYACMAEAAGLTIEPRGAAVGALA